MKKHPSGLLNGLTQMMDTRDLSVRFRWKTIDGTSQFFYALIANGMSLTDVLLVSALQSRYRPILTALAAERSVTPTHKLKLILSEQTSS